MVTTRHLQHLRRLAQQKSQEIIAIREEISGLETRTEVMASKEYRKLLDKIATIASDLHLIRLNITKKTEAYQNRVQQAKEFKAAIGKFRKQEREATRALVAAEERKTKMLERSNASVAKAFS